MINLQFLFFCLILFSSDELFSVLQQARGTVDGVKKLPNGNPVLTSDFLQAKHFFKEEMEKRGKTCFLALFVLTSPSTGEPLAINCNNRKTQLRGLNTVFDIPVPDSNERMRFKYLEALQDDLLDDYSYLASKGMHLFMSAVDLKKDPVSQDLDNHFQTWMQMEYGDRSLQTVVVKNYRIRDVNTRDINNLHWLLNIKIITTETSVSSEDTQFPVSVFEHVTNQLLRMSLHDSVQMRRYIEEDLGLPLFKDIPKTEVKPIWFLWKRLNLFLQFASPISLSPVEGAHRTWEIFKFFSGADFVTKIPQPLVPMPRDGRSTLTPNFNMKPRGLSQAEYKFTIWQRKQNDKNFDFVTAKNLREISKNIKETEDVQCNDTNDSWFQQVFQAIDDKFFQSDETKQFTSQEFFRNSYALFDVVEDRLGVIGQLVMDAYKLKFKETWKNFKQKPSFEDEKRGRGKYKWDKFMTILVRNQLYFYLKLMSFCLTF